jgi:hypothetical protein
LIVSYDTELEVDWMLLYALDDPDKGGTTISISKIEDEIVYISAECRDNSKRRPLILKTNIYGDELGYYYIHNDSIEEGNKWGIVKNASFMEDGKLVGGGDFTKSFDYYDHNIGKIVFDTLGNVYNFDTIPNTINAIKMEKTYDNNFLQGGVYKNQNNIWDAYLHKHTATLEPAPINNDPIEYDYLCPETIQSEDIQLTDCITVGVEDLPTPKEYYSYIATIPIRIYPNPASNIIHFAMENTEHHSNITLQVFDINGRPIIQQSIQKGQKEATTNVSQWQSGMYAVVVFSNGKVMGKEKFVVR